MMESNVSLLGVYSQGHCHKSFKGEVQHRNKLISSERPFKILQNQTKIVKIGQAVLEILESLRCKKSTP